MFERSWVRIWHHILMDMTFFRIDLLLKLFCLFEKTKNKRKRGRGWPIKKRLDLRT